MNCDYCGKEKWELMTIQVEWVTYYNCWPCTKLYLAQYGWDVDNITGYYYNCKLVRNENPILSIPYNTQTQ